MLKYLLEKEFKLIFRNKVIVLVIIVFPIMALIMMPNAANLEIKDTRIAIVDNDRSSYSAQLCNRLASNHYFYLAKISLTYREALAEIEKDNADVILIIPKDFEKSYRNGQPILPSVSANAVNGMKGSMGAAYVMSGISDFLTDKKSELLPHQSTAVIRVAENYLFNKTLDYKMFMVPALMVMLLTIMCGFLPAMNIVAEKESGTIEQMNVSPVKRFTFTISKLIPYWIIGTIVISIGFLLAFFLYGIRPQGNILVCYFYSFIFTLAVSGLGLILSNYAKTYQQAMFMMFFFMIILVLMSGLFTPVRSMPDWTQWVATVSPLRYYIEAMRAVYLRGSGIANLLPQLYIIAGFAVLFNSLAVWSYHKRG
jgi:ABC-2 type transport system permease protein